MLKFDAKGTVKHCLPSNWKWSCQGRHAFERCLQCTLYIDAGSGVNPLTPQAKAAIILEASVNECERVKVLVEATKHSMDDANNDARFNEEAKAELRRTHEHACSASTCAATMLVKTFSVVAKATSQELSHQLWKQGGQACAFENSGITPQYVHTLFHTLDAVQDGLPKHEFGKRTLKTSSSWTCIPL